MVIKCVVVSGNEHFSSFSVVAVNSTACFIKQRINKRLNVNQLREYEMVEDWAKKILQNFAVLN